MDFNEELSSNYVRICFQKIVNFVIWYMYTIVCFPAILLLFCIILQYVFGHASKIRFWACYGTYILYSTTVVLIVWPVFVISMNGVYNCLYGANMLKHVSKIIDIKFELRNGHILSKETGTAVIVANHQSFFDVLGMFTIWHVMQKCTAVARRKVFWIWPFGLLAWVAGVVFIDRIPSYDKTYKTINKAAEYVCKQKSKLWMFPEGTRNRNPATLLPFKKGAFRVAICCQIPIIPVVFSPYYFVDGETMYFGRGTIIIEALNPVPTKGLTLDDIEDLMAKVTKLMSDKNNEFRKMIKNEQKLGRLPCSKNL